MKKAFTVILAIAVLLVIGYGVATWLKTSAPTPPRPTPAAPAKPSQPDWCPDVEVIAAPGTWESTKTDDTAHPRFNPHALLTAVTTPLAHDFPTPKVKIWTLPYTAQFKNIHSMDEMSYDDSRREGTERLARELADTHKPCPYTDYVLMGFSQGAVIVGDLANKIGSGIGPVPADRVRGIALVADGRRQAGVGQTAGARVVGVGAEISLKPLNKAVQLIIPGATMRGPRAGGFGSLDKKTVEICAPGDHICDAPVNVGDALNRATQLIENNGVHAQYATNRAVFGNETTVQWLITWAKKLISLPPATITLAPSVPAKPGAASSTVTTVPPIPAG